MSDPSDCTWVPIPVAADYHHVSPRTIRNWITTGHIRSRRVGPRFVRVELHSAEAEQ